MNKELFERVLVQLQPELAQEFGYAVLEDNKKLKALEIIKEHIFYDEKTDVLKANFQEWYEDKETQDLLKEILK